MKYLVGLLLFCNLAWAEAPGSSPEDCAALLAPARGPVERTYTARIKDFAQAMKDFFTRDKREEDQLNPPPKQNQKQNQKNSGKSGAGGGNSGHDQTYQAHNKDTDDSKKESGPLQVAVRVHQRPGLAYFLRTAYQSVNPATGTMSLTRVRATQKLHSDAVATPVDFVNLGDYPLTTGMAPLVPAGFELVNSPNFKTNESGNPEYTGPGTEGVTAALIPSRPQALNDHESRAYLALETPLDPAYFPAWINHILADLTLKQKAGMGDLEIAAALVYAIKTEMVYRVDQDAQIGVQQWLYSKGCQCDGAAVISVSILRQFFKVRARPVAGFMGSTQVDDPKNSVVVLPTQGHAWIQVYADGLWHDFDPTPSSPDRQKDEKKGDERFTSNTPPSDGPAKEEKDDGKPQEKGNPSGKVGRESKTFIPREISPREQYESALAHAGGPASLGLELERVRLSPATQGDPFVLGKVESMLKSLGDHPAHAWTQAVEDAFKNYMPDEQNFARAQTLKNLREVALTLAESKHPSAVEFQGMALAIDRMLPRKSKVPSDALTFARETMKSLRDRPLESQWIAGEFPNLTEDAAVAQKFVDAIKTDKLPFFLIRKLVAKYLDLDLLLTPRQKKIYLQHGNPEPFGNGDMHLRDMREYENPERIYRDGSPASWDYFRAASGDLMEILNFTDDHSHESTPEDTRTSTILVTDMSGSMRGGRGQVRDALVLRYLDAVANQFDNGPSGSQLIYLPYGDRPFEAEVITTRDELYAQFKNWANAQRRSGGGNNTALALVRAFELAKAQSGQFHRVNIVLITDGDEVIDVDHILKKQRELDQRVEVNLAAITIVEGNDEIRQLTVDFANKLTSPSLGVRLHHVSEDALTSLLKQSSEHGAGGQFLLNQTIDWSAWHNGRQTEQALRRLTGRIR